MNIAPQNITTHHLQPAAAQMPAAMEVSTNARPIADNRTRTVVQKKQLAGMQQPVTAPPVLQRQKNNTGLPDNLKSGIENLSGISMNDIKVHYNSPQPAQLQAHAYAQGTDIHLGPGQEKHLPHEAWHVVQQKQGRVRPTMQLKGKVNVNDDKGLEREADVMGARALQMKPYKYGQLVKTTEELTGKSAVPLPGNHAAAFVQKKSLEGMRRQQMDAAGIQLKKYQTPVVLTGQEYSGANMVVQKVRYDNGQLQLDLRDEDGRINAYDGATEAGYVSFDNIGRGVASQSYISVKPAYQRHGIAYLLSYEAARVASEAGINIIYLGGGSLSPSGSGVAAKLGFKEYAPGKKAKKKSKGLLSCFSCFSCCGSDDSEDAEPLLESQAEGQLAHAYRTQADQAGGEIPPIKWLSTAGILSVAGAKIREKNWRQA